MRLAYQTLSAPAIKPFVCLFLWDSNPQPEAHGPTDCLRTFENFTCLAIGRSVDCQ